MDEIKREKYKKIGEKGVTLTSIFIFLSMTAFSNKNIILKIIFGLMISGIIIIFILLN